MSRLGMAGMGLALAPKGLRRAGCALVLIMLVGIGGLMAFAAWKGRGLVSADSEALPCPPEVVTVAPSLPTYKPAAATVARTITMSGRRAKVVERSTNPTFVVVVAPGAETRVRDSAMHVARAPSAAEASRLLAPVVPSCKKAPAASEGREKDRAPETKAPWAIPGGAALIASLGVWWLVGPEAVKGAWRAAWPLRLAWRKVERWVWRRRLARGATPREFPRRVGHGQRWHDDPEAMRDMRTPRQQARPDEPARRAGVRQERAARSAIWRLVYRERREPEAQPESAADNEAREKVEV